MVDTPPSLKFSVFSHVAHKRTMTVQERLEEFVDEVELVDSLSYDSMFTTEHHFSGDFSLSPSQPVTLTLMATHSQRMRFGPMVIILPISDPLRVAEELVILDHLSGGRLEAGFGRGSLPHEHIMFGIAPKSDRARLDEGLEVIERIWTSDYPVFYSGEYYRYHGVEMPWKPVQRPHPPIWVPSASRETSLKWAARGYGTGGFGLLPLEVNKIALDAYREGWEQGGRRADTQRISYMVSTYVGENDRTAKRLARESFAYQMELFQDEAAVTHRLNGLSGIKNSERDPYARLVRGTQDGSNRHALVCGSPSAVIEQIEELRAVLGFNLFMGEFNFGLMPFAQVADSLQLFSEEVIPKLSPRCAPLQPSLTS